MAETATDQKFIERAQKILRPAMRYANIVQKLLTIAGRRKIDKSIVDVHLAFSSRQSDKLRTFVNLRIKMITDSGKLQEIVERYYKPAVPPPN